MELSVVIPVYNAEQSVKKLIEELIQTLEKQFKSYEIILVDDSSVDNTWEILKQIKNRYSNELKLIKLGKNVGQHNATFCGIIQANGDYVATMDDDCQHNPKYIKEMHEKCIADSSLLCYGIGNNEHSRLKRTGSYLWNKLSAKLDSGTGIGTSFRIIHHSVISNLKALRNPFIYIDEILNWQIDRKKISYVKITHRKSAKTKSTYSNKKTHQLIQQISFSYSLVPIKILIRLVSLIALISFLLGIYFIARKLFYNVNTPGYTSVIVAILFSSSIIILSIGLLARYLGGILMNVNGKPSFSIIEQID